MKINKNQCYVKIQGMFLASNKNVFVLTWLILFRTRPFNLHLPAQNIFLRPFPSRLIKVLRVLNIIYKLLLLKLSKKYLTNISNSKIIKVPYNGHILLKTTLGYKVFNLKERKIATQYRPNMKESEFIRITKNLGNISNYNISPYIIGVNYSDRCIYEEYLNLYKAENFYPISFYFYDKIFPIWERNIKIYNARDTGLIKYIAGQEYFILDSMVNVDKHEHGLLDHIREYTKLITQEIKSSYSQTSIKLTLTHGDFHAWNILLDKRNAILIDWDTLKERTIFHDLFYMFFYNLFGKKQVNYDDFLEQLDKCLFLANSNLQYKVYQEELNRDLYRMLFYIEYVCLYFEKKINLYTNRKQIEEGLKNLSNDIKIFQDIEAQKKTEIAV